MNEPIYRLEIFLTEKNGSFAHEEVNGLQDIDQAKLIVATLEEYKQKILTFIMINQESVETKPQTPKKAE